MSRPLGVAVVGFGWMGQVHARSYARVPHHYDLPVVPDLIAVAESDAARRDEAVQRYGFADATADWRDVVADPRVEAVSVTAPNSLHREIGCAVAQAGKHLWIEKPVGLNAADTEAVAVAAAASGVRTAVGFNYRNAPAVEHARALIADGAIGRVTNADLHLFADYAAHPHGALSWRFERALGGAGVLGDLVSHGVDLARFVVGDIAEVVADTATFVPQRPLASGTGSHYAVSEGGDLGDVENEDYLGCLVRFAGGGRGSIRSSRVSVGDQCTYGFTVHGTRGQLSWDFRRMGELVLSAGDAYLEQPSQTLLVGPPHGELGAFQPGAGIAMGYDDLKVIEAERFLRSIADGVPHGATVEDAVVMARTLDAIAESAASGRWVGV